jgi:hypothetical protein
MFRHIGLAALALYFVTSAVFAQQGIPPVGSGFPQGKPIDTAGFFLGMDGNTAKALLNKHYPTQPDRAGYAQTKPQFNLAALPGSSAGFLRVATATYYPAFYNYDNVVMVFSTIASGNQAVFIVRDVNFRDSSRPSKAATLAAIQAKFGVPSREVHANANEYYYVDGRLLGPKETKEDVGCQNGANAIYRLGSGGQNIGERDIGDGFRNFNRAVQSSGVKCDIYIRVEWQRSSDTVNGVIVPNENALGSLKIRMFDHARFVATNAVDVAAIEAINSKARDAMPKGTAAPKL